MRQFKLMQTKLIPSEPSKNMLAALVNIRGHQLVLQEWKTQLIEPVRLQQVDTLPIFLPDRSGNGLFSQVL